MAITYPVPPAHSILGPGSAMPTQRVLGVDVKHVTPFLTHKPAAVEEKIEKTEKTEKAEKAEKTKAEKGAK